MGKPWLLFTCVILAMFVGCAIYGLKPITKGEIRSPGCTIRAADGSFTLEYGKVFATPFYCNASRSTERWPKSSLPLHYQDFLGLGPRRVYVEVPGRSEPLYGMLLFLSVPPDAIGPSSRCYQITVPDEYVREAEGGGASVVFEYVKVPKSKFYYYGWVLWLQDMPF